MSLKAILSDIIAPDRQRVGTIIRVGSSKLTISTKKGSVSADVGQEHWVAGDRVVLDPMGQVSHKLYSSAVTTYVV